MLMPRGLRPRGFSACSTRSGTNTVRLQYETRDKWKGNHDRYGTPRDDAEEREQYASEHVGRAGAAACENGFARSLHVRQFWRVSCKLEREIRFHAGAHVEGPAMDQRPSAVLLLQAAEIAGDLRFQRWVGLAQEMQQRDVLRRNGGVGFQLEHPVTIGALTLKQRRSRRLDGTLEARHTSLDMDEARRTFELHHRLRPTGCGMHGGFPHV